MRRLPREVWWLLGLTIVMALLAFALGSGTSGGVQEHYNPDRTTFNRGTGGLRALYLTLGRLGYPVRRWHRPFVGRVLPAGTLVIAEPTTPISPSEWENLHAWIGEGNTLLFTSEYGRPGTGDEYEQRETAVEKDRAEAPLRYAAPSQPSYLARGVARLRLRTHSYLSLPQAVTAGRSKKAKKKSGAAAPLPFVPTAQAEDLWGRTLAHAAPVFANEHGPAVSYARIGKGMLVVTTSPWSLSNDGIAHADNFPFVLNAVGAPDRRPVVFDEYHHGFGENLAWALVPRPVKWALLVLLLAFVVLVYARSRRFGRIVPLLRQSRERSEFLGTMTALLRRGEATRLAVRTASEAALHRLRRQLGLPEEAEVEEVGRAAQRLDPKGGARLETALAHCQEALARREGLTEGRALALVRELDEAERTLQRI